MQAVVLDRVDKNESDYILVDEKLRKHVLNAKVVRGTLLCHLFYLYCL